MLKNYCSLASNSFLALFRAWATKKLHASWQTIGIAATVSSSPMIPLKREASESSKAVVSSIFQSIFLTLFIRGTSPILGRPHLKHYGHADTFQSAGSASSLANKIWHNVIFISVDHVNCFSHGRFLLKKQQWISPKIFLYLISLA